MSTFHKLHKDVISDALVAKCMEKEMSVVASKAGSNSVVLNCQNYYIVIQFSQLIGFPAIAN